FARHYYRNHCYFLFLRVLRCFTSPRSPHAPYTFRHGSPPLTVAGFPHSDILGSTPVYRLPEAYRRFPRPSSAPDAKASTMRSHTLTTPIRVSSMCARNVSNTLVFDDKKITLHKQHKNVVDARVHYTILKPLPNTTQEPTASAEIGRASCRERESISEVAESQKKKNKKQSKNIHENYDDVYNQ